jgi:hypothetical protein
MLGSSRVGAQLAASQEGLSSMSESECKFSNKLKILKQQFEEDECKHVYNDKQL